MILAEVYARLDRLEGRTTWMYLDTVGVVTVGVGHALPTVAAALELPWSRPKGVVAVEYQRVHALEPGRRALFYEQYTEARIAHAEVDRLRDHDVGAFLARMRLVMPDFPTWPEPAQQAVFDIVYNCGPAGALKFKRMLAAIRAGNWDAAALESERPAVSEARNTEIASLLASLAPPDAPIAT